MTEGAEHLIRSLKALGYRMAILSGGFTYFARHPQQKLGIDYIYANELEIVDGKVTGQVKGRLWMASARPSCCWKLPGRSISPECDCRGRWCQ